ncbi:MAG: hypothetical protein JWM80_3277, partial [Cyanobacteria bacterium RYN_339]|nr:hypothetical protein [Cyanobacteria bacterium RYN_339]
MLAPNRFPSNSIRPVGPVTASQPAGGGLGSWLSGLFGNNQPPAQQLPVQQVYQPSVYLPAQQ